MTKIWKLGRRWRWLWVSTDGRKGRGGSAPSLDEALRALGRA